MNDTQQSVSATPIDMPLTASILLLACFTGCATPNEAPQTLPTNTQLAISPNGTRLLMTWRDQAKKHHAKLLELQGSEVTSEREINLPARTFATEFGSSNDHILVTTFEKGFSELIKIKVSNDQPTLIYKSNRALRFPLEVTPDNYVFLEDEKSGRPFSYWQRLQNGQKIIAK